MKIMLNLFALILLGNLSSCTSAESSIVVNNSSNHNTSAATFPTPKPENNVWQPAVFNGIKIGQDSRAKAIEILGKPSSSVVSDNNDQPIGSDIEGIEIIDTYENFGFYSSLTVFSSKKNGIITEIEGHSENLTVEEVIKLFGMDYKKTQYDFVVCPNDAGSSAIYESPNGELKYLEYRSKGTVIEIDGNEKYVERVIFVSEPIGLTSPTCPK